MNPEFVKTKADQRRVRKEYINNLRLMTSNEQKNYNANLIMKETGQVPMEPLDARSLTEKKADIERLKIELRMRLIESTLMDGSNSSQGVQELIKKPDMLVFAVNNFDLIYGYLKPRYSLGVPYLIYLDTIEKLMEEKVNDAFRQFGFFENTTDGGNNDTPYQSFIQQHLNFNTYDNNEYHSSDTRLLGAVGGDAPVWTKNTLWMPENIVNIVRAFNLIQIILAFFVFVII